MKVGDIIETTGLYVVNPQFYEFWITTQEPLPVGELISFEGDPASYRVIQAVDTNALIRLMPAAQGDGAGE